MKGHGLRISGIAKGVVLVLLWGLLISVVYAATNSSGIFKDTVGHWASSQIQRLTVLGILTGYGDGTFKPDKQISRAEVAAVIDRTLDIVGYENRATAENIARGGRLYDNWTKESGAAKPTDDHPLWALQTLNKRSGSDTWRCKECHGWDYKGRGGAYSSGSHATGFPGVYRASTTMSKAQLVEVLKGSTDYRHDFSRLLKEESLSALADFLREGLINDAKYIDYSTKEAIGANLDSGKQKYDSSCASCHGSDGTQLNFGSEQKPEYVGTIARDNPWEFIHKVRFGQPGSGMPFAAQFGWNIGDIVDVLGYSQTLPKSK